MFRTPRTLIVPVLMLVLSHAPIPWMHDHCRIDNRQLAGHLRFCHADANESTSPKGWHVHLLPFELLAGDETSQRTALFLAESVSSRHGLPTLGSSNKLSGTIHAATCAKRGTELLSGLSRSARVAVMLAQCEVYKLLNVLLL